MKITSLVLSVVALGFAGSAQAATLWDNGPLSTGPVGTDGTVAPEGTTWSETHGGTIGWTASPRSNGSKFRILDDFTVPAGQTWTIDAVHVFSYVSDAPADVSRIKAATIQIWSGTPGAGGSVVYGDVDTNRLTSSVFSSVYRAELNFMQTQRPLWDNTIGTIGLVLGPGTYWIDWDTRFNLDNRTFAVPATLPGLDALPNANGLQSTFTPATGLVTYAPLTDSGVGNAQQETPFLLEGSAVPEAGGAGVMLSMAMLGLARRRR